MLSTKQQLSTWTSVGIAAISTAVLAMHAYLGSYSRFMADDYCSAAQEHRFGILRAAWYWFRTWNGRYSANVLDAIFGALGPRFTPFVTGLVLLIWLVALTTAVFLLTGSSRPRSERLWLSAALGSSIIAITLALAPDVPQALYWGQGMRAIIPPLVCMCLYVALFLWARRHSSSGRLQITWCVVSFLLAYGAGGFSETYTALQLAALVLALIAWYFFARRSLARGDLLFLLAGLLGAILSFVTVMLAPGNAARAAFYPAPPSPLPLMGIALASYAAFFAHIAGSLPTLVALIAALLLGAWAGAALHVDSKDWRLVLLVLAIGDSLIFCCFPPAAYGESQAPPDRTLLIPTFLLVLTALAVGISLPRWLRLPRPAPRALQAAVLLFVLITAAFSILHIVSAQPEYAAYASAWSRFDSQMVQSRAFGLQSVQLSTAGLNASNWSRLNTLGDNPKFWVNQCVSDYYGVKVLSTTP